MVGEVVLEIDFSGEKKVLAWQRDFNQRQITSDGIPMFNFDIYHYRMKPLSQRWSEIPVIETKHIERGRVCYLDCT